MMPTFDDVTDTVLLHIRSAISSLSDLSAHIAFSQTCRRVRHLYLHDDSFWQLACFSAGFGRPRKRRAVGFTSPTDNLSWREIAHVLTNHTSRCEINSCVDANGCFVDFYKRTTHAALRGSRPNNTDVVLHPLYFYLHFSEVPAEDVVAFVPFLDTLSILLSHLPTFPESRTSQYGPLCSHPNASCAFATFPPMESLNFQDAEGRTFLAVENPDGCTILDVNRALAELLPRDVALEAGLEHYRGLLHTSGLSPTQFADMVSQQRGFLGDHEYPFLEEFASHP